MASTTSRADTSQKEQKSRTQEEVRVAAVSSDRLQVEFRIDDLVRRIVEDRLARASCSGCRGCSAAI